MLADDATYCDACNTPQTAGFDEFEPKPKKGNDTFLKVLCILIIVGFLFTVISTVVSFSKGAAAYPFEGMELLTYIGVGISIVKLIAAVLMLQKKLMGLYIYSIAALVGIAVTIYSLSLTANYLEATMGGAGRTIMIASGAVMVVISLVFLILFWLPVNKKLLS